MVRLLHFANLLSMLSFDPFTFSKADNQFPRSIPEPTPLIHETTTTTRSARPPSPPLPACCGRLPASVVNKLNKLSLRSGLFKVVGEFGLRENLYYGSIFICMTLIVIVCFLVINNRGGAGLSGLMSGGSAAAYEGGKIHLLFPQRAISHGRLSKFHKCV